MRMSTPVEQQLRIGRKTIENQPKIWKPIKIQLKFRWKPVESQLTIRFDVGWCTGGGGQQHHGPNLPAATGHGGRHQHDVSHQIPEWPL
jgi:hypothetical protein